MLKRSLQYTNSNLKEFLLESHPFKVTSYLSETGNILEVRDFLHGITRLLKTEHLSAVITIQVKLDKEGGHYTFYASKLARQLQTGVAVKNKERERKSCKETSRGKKNSTMISNFPRNVHFCLPYCQPEELGEGITGFSHLPR